MRKNFFLYIAIVLLFLVETVLFMLYHWGIFGQYSFGEWILVLYHSLPHDLSVAGYFMIIPFLLGVIHECCNGAWYEKSMRCYVTIMLPLMLTLWTIDVVLYGYWGFRLDATPFIYLMDSPWQVLTQMEWWQNLIAIPLFAGFIIAGYYSGKALFACKKKDDGKDAKLYNRVAKVALYVPVLALMFIAIRGGVSESTMNVGRAYFSTEMSLNHAATNPLFSLLYSVTKIENLQDQYRFMSTEECRMAISELYSQTDTLAQEGGELPLLKTQRPNIIIIIFEGFSGAYCKPLYADADPNIMPTVNKMYDDGIGFTNFYANSWRTDRGVASILAAYPAQPTYTVMKHQDKCNNLNYLSQSLKNAGYGLQFVHAGDVNFTNMKGFLLTGGYNDILADSDFPEHRNDSEWGAPDEFAFERLYQEMEKSHKTGKPYMKTMLTLSSHEPFDVPYRKYSDPYINSVAYTDSCFNVFLEKVKRSEMWENLLIIGLPDHCSAFPLTYDFSSPDRYHIPMFWVGGAIAKPQRIGVRGQQTDLAATLLQQLGIGHDEFVFSKDLMSKNVPHFAFYDFPDGFGFLTDSIFYVQDNQHDGTPLHGSHDPEGKAQRWGKAYLQNLYDDLSKR